MKIARLTMLINRYIKPEFPGYRQKGRDFFKEPLEYVLRGYSFGSESGVDSMYVFVVILPLYTLHNHLSVGAGSRILGTDVTADNETAAMEEVVRAMKSVEHHVDRLSDPASLAHDQWALSSNDEYALEMSAYSLVLAGDCRAAEASLKSFMAYLARTIPRFPLASWLPVMDARAAKLLEALRKDPQLAVAMLDEWTAQTKAKLKLT